MYRLSLFLFPLFTPTVYIDFLPSSHYFLHKKMDNNTGDQRKDRWESEGSEEDIEKR